MKGEFEHHCSKQRYPHSGKKKGSMVRSIANQEAIERFIKKVNDAWKKLNEESHLPLQCLHTSPFEHYHMAENSQKHKDLMEWLSEHRGDPTFKVCEINLSSWFEILTIEIQDFIPCLEDHLLACVCGIEYDGDEHAFSNEDCRCINIKGNHVYLHSLLWVNYTTYNLQCEQDTINPLTQANIMVLSHEDECIHPYWYAHVVKIFHIMVQSCDDRHSIFSAPSWMNVLFVWWFRHDVNYLSGWQEKRLHRLQFFDQENPSDAFGFIDPNSIVCGVHIIPAFAYGCMNNLLGPSQA